MRFGNFQRASESIVAFADAAVGVTIKMQKEARPMELKVNLPDTLANEAQVAGLLTPSAIEHMLREVVRSKAVNELFETADLLGSPSVVSPI